MYDFIFTENKKNAYELQKEYSISDHDTDYIYRSFWPIIIVHSVDIEDVKTVFQKLIGQFKSEYQVLDYEIFYRNHLEFLVYSLKRYLSALQTGKIRIWDTYKGTNFIRFKLPGEFSNSQTMLLSDKGEIELEIFFKELLKTIESFIEEHKNENLQSQQIKKRKPKLTINQIALKHVYSELQITRENGDHIVSDYGHNSGEKLFQRFTYYSSLTNRKGKPQPCTPKKLDNKIKLIESVIELLPIDKQQRAKDEVTILKNIQESEYQ